MKGCIKKVTIAIQARTGSARLPGKVDMDLLGSTALERVIEACQESARYLNHYKHSNDLSVNVCVCVPFGDPVGKKYSQRIEVVEGPEKDVLGRYLCAMNKYDSDYVVRITADCPFHASEIISKHIIFASKNGYDYISNVDERFRTAPDGHDCEVISKRLMLWAGERAADDHDREHVTTLIRKEAPDWAHTGFVINRMDHSDLKISLDTHEDLEAIKSHIERVNSKYQGAIKAFGKGHVHRFS